MLGAVVSATDNPHVYQFNLLATDFNHAPGAHPTFLYYNPNTGAGAPVTVNVGSRPTDLYDAVSQASCICTSPRSAPLIAVTAQNFLARGAVGATRINVPADSAVVLVLIPTNGTAVRLRRNALHQLTTDDGVIVDYAR